MLRVTATLLVVYLMHLGTVMDWETEDYMVWDRILDPMVLVPLMDLMDLAYQLVKTSVEFLRYQSGLQEPLGESQSALEVMALESALMETSSLNTSLSLIE